MRVRLQVGVAVVFAALVMAVLALATTLFVLSNRALAIRTAHDAMTQARAATEGALADVVTPVGRVLDLAAALVAELAPDTPPETLLRVMDAEVRGLPQLSSAYVGLAGDGAFLQVVNLAPGDATFGPAAVPVPAGAVRVLRVTATGTDAGPGRDRMLFLAADGAVLGRAETPGDFDPRTRPWWIEAEGSTAVAVHGPYVFSASGRPGVTFSRRVTDAQGRPIGVAGADMTLDSITEVLRALRVHGSGEVFLATADGRLITSSEPGSAAAPGALTAAALRATEVGAAGFGRLDLPQAGGVHLISVAPVPELFGIRPVLGLVVPRDQFVGGIRDSTLRVLQLTAVVAVLGLALVMVLARLMGGALAQVAAEARRIGRFDLGGRFALTSRIVEVQDLGNAVGNMKNSLRSFAAYVPQEVVRGIVASGGTAAVGGEAREVALMFSDIEGFTRKSENLPPLTVMQDLSRYFAALDDAIARHGGTVDKYIGDAVMALWNAPGADPDPAGNACRAALACQAAGQALTGDPGAATLFPVRTRIGLHIDRVVVGNVGSDRRLQYTAIGGAVNLASRVEGLNKVYGTGILATGAVVARAGPAFLFRAVDRVAPAGTSHPTDLFELLGETGPGARHPPPPGAAAEVAAWESALALYRGRDWDAAQAALAALDGGGTPPGLIALYLRRCDERRAAPPPPGWAGVHVFAEK